MTADVNMFEVAHAIDGIATEAKAGTVHASHDGWSFPHDRPARLICGCGVVLVEADGF